MIITETNFPVVYEKYKNTVYSVIFNYVRNVDDANDILQDVFIKLLQSKTEYESDEHLKAWLIRVSINMSINLLKSQSRMSDEAVPEDIPTKEEPHDNFLREMVMRLPEKYRIPLHLFYYEDFSIKKIATIMQIPESTVKIRLKRGREQLKITMRKEDWL